MPTEPRPKCERCNGVGQTRWPLEDGGSPWLDCPACNGTGLAPTVAPSSLRNLLEEVRPMVYDTPQWRNLRLRIDAALAAPASAHDPKTIAGICLLALAGIIKDDGYPCRCGEPPYTDGEQCPRCHAVYASDMIERIAAPAWTTAAPTVPEHCPSCGAYIGKPEEWGNYTMADGEPIEPEPKHDA